MRVHQWYNETYSYKKYVGTDANGDSEFEQAAGADVIFTAKCRTEIHDYTKTAFHQDEREPDTKLSTQIKHSDRDYICLPDDDPSDPDKFQRVTAVRAVKNKAGRLVHYVVYV
jgi:hypothetical protein